MGDITIDKWFQKMKQHKEKGHHIIHTKADEQRRNEQTLSFKEQRTTFWEKHHRLPLIEELNSRKLGVNI